MELGSDGGQGGRRHVLLQSKLSGKALRSPSRLRAKGVWILFWSKEKPVEGFKEVSGSDFSFFGSTGGLNSEPHTC
jgi:hypothetical protein